MGEPQWQITDLNTLSSQGKLWGIPPSVLEAIAAEESGFENAGAGVNPQGYGGFFGLGQSSTYPGGTSSRSLLEDPSESSFITQAQLAASEFASLLKGTGGDVYKAEQVYQTGSSSGFGPGDAVFQSYGIPQTLTPGSGVPVTTTGIKDTPAPSTGGGGFDWNPLAIPGEVLGGIFGSAGQGLASGLLGIIELIAKPLKAFVVNGVLIILGALILIIGLVIVADSGIHSAISGGGGGGTSPAPTGGGGRGAEPEAAAEEAPEAVVAA